VIPTTEFGNDTGTVVGVVPASGLALSWGEALSRAGYPGPEFDVVDC
jgi:hypothetical protein